MDYTLRFLFAIFISIATTYVFLKIANRLSINFVGIFMELWKKFKK